MSQSIIALGRLAGKLVQSERLVFLGRVLIQGGFGICNAGTFPIA